MPINPEETDVLTLQELDQSPVRLDSIFAHARPGQKMTRDTVFSLQSLLSRGSATPQNYGAIGDGVADDTEALKQCFLENDNIILFGSYKITDYIEIRANQKIYSENATISRDTTNSSILIALDVNSWQIDGKLNIIGAGKANGTATGINIVGCRKFDIRGVSVSQISGYGIRIQAGSDSLPRGEGGLLINCWFIDNWYGIETNAGAEGEYNAICNCNFTGNNFAASVNAGNTIITGGNIVDNNVGLFVGGALSTNGAHGIINGVQINHNTLNFHGLNIDLGETISGCHFYGEASGSIKLENCIGVSFSNCIIDGKVEIIADSLSGVNSFVGNQLEPSFSLTGTGASSALFTANFTKNAGLSSVNNGNIINGVFTGRGVQSESLIAGEYADNAAAISGGLTVGRMYRTGDVVKIVH